MTSYILQIDNSIKIIIIFLSILLGGFVQSASFWGAVLTSLWSAAVTPRGTAQD